MIRTLGNRLSFNREGSIVCNTYVFILVTHKYSCIDECFNMCSFVLMFVHGAIGFLINILRVATALNVWFASWNIMNTNFTGLSMSLI